VIVPTTKRSLILAHLRHANRLDECPVIWVSGSNRATVGTTRTTVRPEGADYQ
jgi:hypothetical protein